MSYTEAHVEHVFLDLLSKGKEPSIRRVRDELGGGSFATIGPLVKAVREKLIAEGVPMRGISNQQLLDVSSKYPNYRFESDADGNLIIMPPTGGTTGNRNLRIDIQLGGWAEADGTGEAFDSSTLFQLPSGARVAPDFAWILNDRWYALPEADRDGVPKISPDFVLELMSPSDQGRYPEILARMDRYVNQEGVRLAWLIDRMRGKERVYIFRPGQEPEILEKPDTVSADPVMPGAVLKMSRIW